MLKSACLPASPVQAFALPELQTIALIFEFRDAIFCSTQKALALFVVKVPAQIASVSDFIIPRSRF
jgi:hypothetical protein